MTRRILTPFLVLFNLAVYGIADYLGVADQLVTLLAFGAHDLMQGNFLPLLLSGIMHTDLAHLLVNMTFLLIFGYAAEAELGSDTTLLTYLSGIIAGNLAFGLLFPGSTAIGASGGVFAVMAAAITVEPGRPITRYADVPLMFLALPYLLHSLISAGSLAGNVANIAHVGGAVAGISIARWKDPDRAKKGLYAFFSP